MVASHFSQIGGQIESVASALGSQSHSAPKKSELLKIGKAVDDGIARVTFGDIQKTIIVTSRATLGPSLGSAKKPAVSTFLATVFSCLPDSPALKAIKRVKVLDTMVTEALAEKHDDDQRRALVIAKNRTGKVVPPGQVSNVKQWSAHRPSKAPDGYLECPLCEHNSLDSDETSQEVALQNVNKQLEFAALKARTLESCNSDKKRKEAIKALGTVSVVPHLLMCTCAQAVCTDANGGGSCYLCNEKGEADDDCPVCNCTCKAAMPVRVGSSFKRRVYS